MAPAHAHVCVTGGAGFIGSHLCRALLARGYQVTIVDNLSVGRAENVAPGARLIRMDILDAGLADVLRGCDIVCHLAARVAVRSSFEFAVDDATTNVAGTANVLRAAGLSGTVRKVVVASSMAVYAEGAPGRALSESHLIAPASPYGVSKLATEQLTHLMCRHHGMSSIVLRLFNTYGPGQRLSPYVGVATIFMDALRRGDRPIVYGDGEQARDFVHVEDVAAGFVAAVESAVTDLTVNIGSGMPRTVNELLATIAGAMGASSEARHEPPVAGELRYSLADISAARAQLGYEPRRHFGEAVAELVGSESLGH